MEIKVEKSCKRFTYQSRVIEWKLILQGRKKNKKGIVSTSIIMHTDLMTVHYVNSDMSMAEICDIVYKQKGTVLILPFPHCNPFPFSFCQDNNLGRTAKVTSLFETFLNGIITKVPLPHTHTQSKDIHALLDN